MREKNAESNCCKNRLEQINSEVQIHAFVMDATSENMEGLLKM